MKTLLFSTLLALHSLSLFAQPSSCEPIPEDVNFGMCAMVIGVAFVENQGCVGLSGCGYEGSDGINYAGSFYSSLEECNSLCANECLTIPINADFGECDMVLGVANIEGQGCTVLSGCDHVASDGTDYSNFFYPNEDACESACMDDCVDPSLINPDVICTQIWDPVCGCDGITYSNPCEATNYGGVTNFVAGECITFVKEHLENYIDVFPNPVVDELTVKGHPNVPISRIEIIDGQGKLVVLQESIASSIFTVNTSALTKGNYVLRIFHQEMPVPVNVQFLK